MSTQPTAAEILPRIEQAIQRVVQAITAMTPEQTHQPRLGEGRSVKDMVGHLTWWDQWLLTGLPPAPGEPKPDIPLPLADQIPTSDHWVDEINAKVRAYNENREFSALWNEFTDTHARLCRRVSQLSAEDLYDPEGMASVIGYPVAPLICGIYEHYEEHAHELEQLGV